MDAKRPVCEWTCDDVKKWLRESNLARYEATLGEKHAVDGTALLLMTDDDLREAVAGEVFVLGDLKRLLFLTRRLRASAKCSVEAHRTSPSLCVLNAARRSEKFRRIAKKKSKAHSLSSSDEQISTDWSDIENAEPALMSAHEQLERETQLHPRSRAKNPQTDTEHDHNGEVKRTRRNLTESNISATRREREWVPEPEYMKAILSFVYVFAVIAFTALVMVIVHERLPDMSKYPPLPDLVLDHLPETWWAFEACELCGATLFTIFVITVVFHKHRFVVLRRAFSLTGTIFLLRSVTMLVTSLSVPHVRSACRPMPHADWPSRFERALAIWSGFGMRIRGVETCGDYMFSGHTSMLTILNHFVTEYTPRSYYRLHTLCWLLNLFGAFFILLSHEHYTLDVFVAFWVSSRLFLYYHTLANNAVTLRHDRHRTRVWFPLFNYFEARSVCAVPNEFEWPLKRSSLRKALTLARHSVLHTFHFVQALIAATRPRTSAAVLATADAHNHARTHNE